MKENSGGTEEEDSSGDFLLPAKTPRFGSSVISRISLQPFKSDIKDPESSASHYFSLLDEMKDNNVVIQAGNEFLTVKNLRRLKPHTWLDGDAINIYIALLKSINSTFLFLNTTFYLQDSVPKWRAGHLKVAFVLQCPVSLIILPIHVGLL